MPRVLDVEPWTRFFAWWPKRCEHCQELFVLNYGYYRLDYNELSLDLDYEYRCEECY